VRCETDGACWANATMIHALSRALSSALGWPGDSYRFIAVRSGGRRNRARASSGSRSFDPEVKEEGGKLRMQGSATGTSIREPPQGF
jgi:hypothetical protein